MSVPPAADLVKSQPDDVCPVCQDTGVMRWQQPSQGVLREMEHPCINGCGGSWTHPAAERDRVVDAPDHLPERVRGQADEANELGTDFITAMVRRQFPNWGDTDPR